MTYLEQKYERNRVILGLRNNFLPDYRADERTITYQNDLLQKVVKLGKCEQLQLPIYEIYHSSKDARVGLTKEALKIIKGDGYTGQALFLFIPQNPAQYRISLVTYDWVQQECSNPRRFSFLVGENAKIHTANKQLTGKVHTREELLKRFSIEVVNKEFYERIEECFEDLLKTIKYDKAANNFKMKQEFAIRLIGRLVFCWFLKKKTRKDGSQLIPEELLSLSAVQNRTDDYYYYHEILEPLFFETLNRKPIDRIEITKKDLYKDIPFLNGGLFEPHNDDCYNYTTHQGEIGTLQIKNNWFIKLFSVFEEYNFTIDENTPSEIELSVDPEMLGRIFENLLGAINPETKENAKNATGSFYTPRDIVEYMVTESIKQHLINKTNISTKKINDLFILRDEQGSTLSIEERREIYKALTTMKVLDPAVGSGAFPMGILQKAVSIIKEIDPKGEIYKSSGDSIERSNLTQRQLDYKNKYKIIRDCIYGVDIQPMAVEIARLRFFLTLIVEEDENPEPLPNLEFNFACANTLIPLPELDLFSTGDLLASSIDLLKKLRMKFFYSNSEQKEQIKQDFQKIQAGILSVIGNQFICGEGKNIGSYADKLGEWEPFKTKSTPWFDPMWMFGIEDGFDIVIANPPYIQLQENEGLLGNLYEPFNYYTFERTGDIYCLFYEKGLELLKENGILTFITSNKWMKSSYGEKLRDYLSKYQPLYLIDLGAGVFENATVDTNILVIKKGTYTRPTLAHVLHGNNKQIVIPVEQWVKNMFDSNSWVILSPIEQSIKTKIEKYGTPLKDWDIKINRGLLTGCNEAFIITTEKRDEILANCKTEDERKRTDEIIRPILRGRDIKRYKYEWKGLWVIFIPWHFPLHHDNSITGASVKAEELFKKQFPSTYNHLSIYKDALSKRNQAETGIRYEWYALQRWAANYWEDFSKPKIIYGQFRRGCYCFDDRGMFLSSNEYFITSSKFNVKYLLAFLNSKICYTWACMSMNKLGGATTIAQKDIFINTPIPKIILDPNEYLRQLVKKIINANDKLIASCITEIEKYYYNFYNFSDEEIKYIKQIVENSQPKDKNGR